MNNNSKIEKHYFFPSILYKIKYDLKKVECDNIFNYVETGINDRSYSFDKHVLNEDMFSDIKLFIEKHIEKYVYETMGKNPRLQKLTITQSWLNKIEDDDERPTHSHPNSVISGVFYIGRLKDRFSDINFIPPFHSGFDDGTSRLKVISPKSGELLLFPSYLKHWVSRNTSKKPRISLSFNTFPLPGWGNEEGLTMIE
tara:strand:+ start:85 stop:678 length:594 start_codon:yes stop_codon:yes gene_type:complete